MNAPELLATLRGRGARLTVRTGDGGAVLNVAPRGITSDLSGEVARFKPSLLELLEGERREREGAQALELEEARERLNWLERAKSTAGACRSIWRASRRLECERPGLWRRLNASDRHELAVCVALLDASLAIEGATA